ncbi:MAG: translation initiation factor IF-3 [uncultured marine phage]|uniref:Translation initiation factor IF-3 n=1 Tax=uncultured marine phage TaxID=707152 RepID=A0A8D9C8T1_9VIRU|nr:MAG: translation initiation factor IF-3 [uncultured marine phage]
MAKRRNNNRRKPQQEEKNRINYKIRNVEDVRLVGDNVDVGVYSIKEAMSLANDMDLDLVEINGKADPPVCKIIDYKKFLYQQKLHEKEMKKKSKQTQTKEIKFGPNTESNDVDYRTKQAIKFLEQGNKVKASVFFKGRQIAFKDRGEKLLLEFIQSIEEHGTPEYLPKMNGRRMEVTIKPKK